MFEKERDKTYRLANLKARVIVATAHLSPALTSMGKLAMLVHIKFTQPFKKDAVNEINHFLMEFYRNQGGEKGSESEWR